MGVGAFLYHMGVIYLEYRQWGIIVEGLEALETFQIFASRNPKDILFSFFLL